MNNHFLNFSREVQQALENNRPIVALESTIISHGMPYPLNLQTAQEVEAIIRDQGAVPATIALHQGKIQIGLDEAMLKSMAQDETIIKASRSDIAYALCKKIS